MQAGFKARRAAAVRPSFIVHSPGSGTHHRQVDLGKPRAPLGTSLALQAAPIHMRIQDMMLKSTFPGYEKFRAQADAHAAEVKL